MSGSVQFPSVSWGRCKHHEKRTSGGSPFCSNVGMLYNGECWDCRYLFAPADEARLWSRPEFWEVVRALPEPLPRRSVKLLYDRLRGLALGTTERYPDAIRAIARDAAKLVAAYGREHYPEKGGDDGGN